MGGTHNAHPENSAHNTAASQTKSSAGNKYLIIGVILLLILMGAGLVYLASQKYSTPIIKENSIVPISVVPTKVDPTIPYKEEYQNPFDNDKKTQYQNPFEKSQEKSQNPFDNLQ